MVPRHISEGEIAVGIDRHAEKLGRVRGEIAFPIDANDSEMGAPAR
jgi:hypothetical protein